MKKAALILLLVPIIILGSCKKGEEVEETVTAEKPAESEETMSEPERIEVQHILISFQGAIPDETVTRTQEEAEALAQDLLARAEAGEDFDALVKEFTDDQHPGIYRMSNIGIQPDSANQEFPRERMVKAFGDVGFSLQVGEIGMTSFDPDTSKYGWHIIKRLK
jgi:parvulin-like peptidyl-prolyl isomerase